ncbi:DUF1345 domain-containing protein [Devosia sediminis]|uniref:DUF1345 domain-containing protein n=1 Tax=Devosia sediminis TaxID=2798801 RepID=A0A934MQ75_9HYPH|nr:DUF1345 domain-containing protein [Devosia sediminis]MBJ3784084.1 DUF1345 domain-containing protein [Devosia sediminis]
MPKTVSRPARGQPPRRKTNAKQPARQEHGPALKRLMPRHAPFYFGLAIGVVTFLAALWLMPQHSIGLGATGLFVGFLLLTLLKLPYLTADYLRENARDEDTPAGGIFLIVLIVVTASVVSLFLALMGGESPDPWAVAISVVSVLLGWFTVQAMGALHYAYEFYQVDAAAEGAAVEGGLDFQGDEDPDGYDFMYFSYTVGTSVATSDTKVESHKMRRLVMVHLIFSHLFNTIILAAAVNVMLSLGGS